MIYNLIPIEECLMNPGKVLSGSIGFLRENQSFISNYFGKKWGKNYIENHINPLIFLFESWDQIVCILYDGIK